ncbi:LysE/ArgO family amino acid transporter [Testudinibacter aquarius]|uniref:Amino acid transporter n=1 Tax=Testudinibacter aquarius TaxID=1524974 RepID=A0A4V2W192_9PAST|nr:LysE/ArgO family amino acid transporter [Testudinibacter aquarius]KAE9530993.1 amino acid transporter [Testudinibacter aquarius]TCV83349.1 L-lysine exporter family protein LysE/ArgO [Testudinibacter aquarius]TNG91191.1 amino acid transporter [Testudinibacter aquarius]
MEQLIQGFLVSGSLIVAIGAQNAFVLKQGLLKQHIFWVSLTCFVCDFLLICIGVMGLGSLIGQSPSATLALAVIGALFLLVYGARAFRSAYQGSSGLSLDQTGSSSQSALKTVLITLGLTLLNPHVYLDTVVIIGGIASTLQFEQKLEFLIGAIFASGLWFFGLGYGARLLIPLFKRPQTWRILDFAIGCIMWLIAFSLARYAFKLFA